MPRINSREELAARRAKYRDNVVMRLVTDEPETRVEIRVAIGDCGLKNNARDILNAFFNEVNIARLEKVSVIAIDCEKGCDANPKVEPFICGHDPTVDVVFPGKEPVRYVKVTAAQAKEIVSGIAKQLGGAA